MAIIRAGKEEEININSNNWIFLDIGFSNKSKSCGLLIENFEKELDENVKNGRAIEVLYSDAVKIICDCINMSEKSVNLVIEAPLSMMFDSKGNPVGRKKIKNIDLEKIKDEEKTKIRYWYYRAASTVTLATLFLIKEINEKFKNKNKVIRLFEGFIFKSKNNQTSHAEDAILLRDIVAKKKGKIVSFEGEYSRIETIFTILGMGKKSIPPILYTVI